MMPYPAALAALHTRLAQLYTSPHTHTTFAFTSSFITNYFTCPPAQLHLRAAVPQIKERGSPKPPFSRHIPYLV